MFIQKRIEDCAVAIISSSLASGSVAWNVYQGLDSNIAAFPCVKVVCNTYTPFFKELNVGVGTSQLEIMTCALRVNAEDTESTTTPQDFETVSDLVFNPFLADTIANTMSISGSNISVKNVSESGLDVANLDDGWIATQKFEIICSRTA